MSVTDKAEQHGRDVSRSKPFRLLVTLGLIGVGIVHILIGVLALRMAWGAKQEEVDKQGAFQQISETPFGLVLLWILGIALFALALWKITQAAWGYTWEQKKSKRARKRIAAVGAAVLYGFFAVSAIRFATSGSGGSSDQKQQTIIGSLLSKPFGVVLACILAAGIIGYAGILVKRGVTASFTKEMEGEPGRGAKRLGQIGYIAKGVAIALVGVMIGWAALTFDPQKAGGLDHALETVRSQTMGPILLSLIALGLIAFGVFCFSWSRHARHS